MDFALFGIQGSGKGTQSVSLSEKHKLPLFETGAQLRRLARESSPLGEKIKSIIEAGQLVPTAVVMEIAAAFLQSHREQASLLFDGVPRSLEQEKALAALLKEHGRSLTGILIELTEEKALQRLLTRRICRDCKTVYPADFQGDLCRECGGILETRQDDKEEAIRTRLALYAQETLPVIRLYAQNNRLITVNGDQDIAAVNAELEEKLASFWPQA